MAAKSSDAPDPATGHLRQQLRQALEFQWARDLEATLDMGELMGEGYTPSGAMRKLSLSHHDAALCVARIQRIAHTLEER